MTLIAGFRSASPEIPEEEYLVACADSQETVRDEEGHEYRVTRQKIKPVVCGNFELAIGGSGANGDLIDACVHRLHKAVKKLKATILDDLEDFIGNELMSFYKSEAKLYVKQGRTVNLLILARSLNPAAVQMWQTKSAQVIPVEKQALVGWNHDIYEHFADRFYQEDIPRIPPQQAILLGMYLMALAENTSNYVRGPITVVVAKKRGITVLDKNRVKGFSERIALFTAQLDSLILACADHTLRRKDYIEKLDEFKATALHLRDEYVQEAVATIEQLATANDPVPNLPIGGFVARIKADHTLDISEAPETVGQTRKRLQWLQMQAGAGPVRIKINCIKCAEVFEIEAPNYRAGYGREFKCEKCGETNRVAAVHMDNTTLMITPSAEQK